MPANHHATVVVLRDRGILIRGMSGAGKSTLALTLVEAMHRRNAFARVVADDQVLLERRGRRLVAGVPATIAGLVEIRPLGPRAIAHEPAVLVDLVVDLEPAEGLSRMHADAHISLEGVELPLLALPQRDRDTCATAVLNFVFGRQDA